MSGLTKDQRHGMSGTPTYCSWAQMIARCLNPKRPKFERYGGRGITVCAEWKTFSGFLADMGIRPEGTELERNNNDGNYEPGNCRWATRLEQCNNTSWNRMVTHEGKTRSIADWARALAVPYDRIRSRIRRGWTPERALGIQ